jgi:hypothetical protein
MRKPHALKGTAALAAVLPSVLIGQSPTSAHAALIYHGKDIGQISADHVEGRACDNEKDGHIVYAEFRTAHGTERVYDTNGSKEGCGSEVFAGLEPAYQYRVCEENKGCTDWYAT